MIASIIALLTAIANFLTEWVGLKFRNNNWDKLNEIYQDRERFAAIDDSPDNMLRKRRLATLIANKSKLFGLECPDSGDSDPPKAIPVPRGGADG